MLLLPPLAADIMDVAERTSLEAEKAVVKLKQTVSPETQELVQAFWAKLENRSTTADQTANQTARFGNVKEFPYGNPRK